MTRITGVTLSLLLSLSAALLAVPATAQDPLVPVAGAEPAGGGADRLRPVSTGSLVNGQLALNLANPGLAEQSAASISPDWGRPARYGPLAGSVEAARAYLVSHGLRVTSVSPQGTLVNFSGPAGAVAAAFNTGLSAYRDRGTGRVFQATDSNPLVPSSLASRVSAVLGLSERWQRRHPHLSTAPRASTAPVPGTLTPADAHAMYGLGAAPVASLDGTGQTIGLLELGIFSSANILQYDTTYYNGRTMVPPPQPTVASNTLFLGPGEVLDTSPGFETEVELDIEVVQALAPGATIKVYQAGNFTPDINNAYSAMVNDPSLSAISTSWGMCELQQGRSATLAQHNILIQSAVPIFAASGDAGAYDCRDPSNPGNPSNPYNNTLAVDSPASDPAVSGTGGTSPLGAPAYSAYPGESAWASSPEGGGGGLSAYFARPTWQAGPGTDSQFAGGQRQVPDVALAADPGHGYSIYSVDSNGSPGWLKVGGTSAAAPGWAGAVAIIDQYRASQGTARLGPGNPVLYGAAQCPQASAPFHDVRSSNNLFYPATLGFDLATGLGSMNLGSLTTAIGGLPAAALRASYMSSHEGLNRGGQAVAITGCGFAANAAVSFGGTGATVTRVSSTVLWVTVPAGATGTASVTVTNPGEAPVVVPGGYLYDANTLIGGTAADNALWTSTNSGPFNSLGGYLLDAPATVALSSGGGSIPLFIGTGGDHDLWVRSLGLPWQRLTDTPVFCLGSPAAAVLGSSLVVACQGGDRALWTVSTALPASGLPSAFHGDWQTLGGALAAGPAVTGLGGSLTPTYLVVGTDHVIYQRGLFDPGYTQSSWGCTGHPALATFQSTSYFACRGGDGAMWYASYSGGWSGASSLGGQVIDGPGIALSAAGPQFVAEGGNRVVYSRTLSAGWSQVGGLVNHGVSAVALN